MLHIQNAVCIPGDQAAFRVRAADTLLDKLAVSPRTEVRHTSATVAGATGVCHGCADTVPTLGAAFRAHLAHTSLHGLIKAAPSRAGDTAGTWALSAVTGAGSAGF